MKVANCTFGVQANTGHHSGQQVIQVDLLLLLDAKTGDPVRLIAAKNKEGLNGGLRPNYTKTVGFITGELLELYFDLSSS